MLLFTCIEDEETFDVHMPKGCLASETDLSEVSRSQFLVSLFEGASENSLTERNLMDVVCVFLTLARTVLVLLDGPRENGDMGARCSMEVEFCGKNA